MLMLHLPLLQVISTVGSRPEDIGRVFGQAQDSMRQARKEVIEHLMVSFHADACSCNRRNR